jgi:2',3'-cyclic-nucleotide 2'-phosphodiesterase (5'-nucleotidase family)
VLRRPRRSQGAAPSPASRFSGFLLSIVVALVTAAALAAPTSSTAEPPPGPDTLLVYGTGDTDGQFARPRCRRSPILRDNQMDWARQAGYYRRFASRADEDPTVFEPVALHLGDGVFPGPVGRFLLQGGESGGSRLARLLEQIPFESLTLGNREIGLNRADLLTFLEGVRSRELPLHAANITCSPEGGAATLCETLGTTAEGRPFEVVERDGVRILLVSVLDPAIRSSIAINRLAGLDLLDPTELLSRELDEYRRRTNPDLVFVQYHAATKTDVDRLTRMSQRVDGIDAVFTNKQMGEGDLPETASEAGYIRAPETGTFILPVGRSPSHASVTELHLDHAVSRSQATGDDWSIRAVDSTHVDTSSGPVDPRTAELLWRAGRRMCRQWGRPIRDNVPLERTFDLAAFQSFVLNVMRITAEAEVALANEGAFLRTGNFPLRQNLTFADIYTILPYSNPLVIARIDGATLEQIAGALDGPAVAEGLTLREDGSVRVNGRPLRRERTYTVATNRFVADGGDRILDPASLQKRATYEPGWAGEPPSIADLIVQFVESGRFARRGSVADRLSPSGNFPDLHRRLLWDLVGSTNLSYNSVAVTSPQREGAAAYDQSQLNVQPTAQINLEGSFQANADSLNHGLDNSLLVQYATARIAGGDQEGFQETRDLIRAKSRYKYAGFRSRLGGQWWVPMPTGELQAETEFDDPDQRDWHKLEVTAILGSTFELADPFEVRLGIDLRRDLNNPGAETVYGLTAGYSLARLELFDVVETPIRFESEFEYFFNNPFSDQIHELRNTNRVFYSLFDRLNITSTFSNFLFRTANVGRFGRNTEFTIGLNYLWDESIQSF